jgi:pyruvate,water dikinase
LRQRQPVLTDQQVRRLVQLGRRIEAHFGGPQDIEWCLGDDDFFIVQSRPITTLFPIPAASDNAPHVYLSVSHQQMMTDATRPLGISIRQLTGAANFLEAGGHLWVDVSRMLATPAGRAGLMGMAGKSDPLTGDALRNIIERDFIPLNPDAGGGTGAQMQARGGPTAPPPIPTDPAIPRQLIERAEASIAALKRDIQGKTGPELLDFILADFQELKRVLMDPMNHPVIMAGTEANWWLNDKLFEWLGEKNVADTLTLSVANNVTSEMGLELMEVADVVRHYPDVVELLEQWSGGAGERGSGGAGERAGERWSGRGGDFMDRLGAFSPGGRAAREAIAAWLEKYGMRTVGEIDITRPRWGERPETIIPMILANVRNFAPGAARHRFEQGLREAARKEEEVLARLRALPDGERKAEETKQMIDRVRTFAGYREYPKYAMMSRYYVYKQALMQEADRLLRAGVLRDREDIFYLTFQELQEVAHTRLVDEQLIRRRREEFAANQRLTVPRVLTSEGEAVAGSYRHDDVPAGALVGLAVSAGTVEGRARVVLDLAKADLEPGDILVTAYTDPSWTPLFVGITGLVTEVGGLMTHGSVIAREYGLPAVVAVSHATQHIRDGQRIRLNGTDGYVELLS